MTHTASRATLLLAGFAAVLFGGCASTKEAPTGPTSGSVRVELKSGSYYGSGSKGKGTLYFNGRSHRFTITGAGLGGMGGQTVKATGRVYNLHSLSDFNGTYGGTSRGLTLGKGKVSAQVKNQRGVVIYLAGETSGVATALGVRAFHVTLAE